MATGAEERKTGIGFIDFLCGFPIDCVEMLVLIGEISSSQTQEGEAVLDGGGKVHAPVPTGEFFKWPEEGKILLNKTALPAKDTEIFPADLAGKPDPTHAHWWLRLHLDGSEKYPVPGEFIGLGVRMMPNMYWGKQKSSPFIWSGNWMDTVYYTGARVIAIISPTGDVPYPTYRVQWRKYVVTAKPSDFALYKVGDWVTILKDVSVEKSSQTWEDGDMNTFGGNWMILPVSFYGLDSQEGG